jgi:hypothetical protein
MTEETPLIWTSKGNLPLEALEYETKWEKSDTYVKFVEIHRLDGEIVREAAHVLALQPLTSMAETAGF